MDEAKFWKLISKAKKESGGDPEGQVALVTEYLSVLPVEEIVKYHSIFHSQKRLAYKEDLWGAAYLMQGGCSDDGFDYFRCWLISQGQETFERAISDPDSLSELGRLEEGEAELEQFAYIASTAYELKTTKQDFYAVARQSQTSPYAKDQYTEGFNSYDFDDETEMKKHFPNLYQMYCAAD